MSSHSSGTANIGGGFDENEPLRQQLNTYIKRVAELETRIEELTIRSEVWQYVPNLSLLIII